MGHWKMNDGLGQVVKDFELNVLKVTLGSNNSAANVNDRILNTVCNDCSFIARKGEINQETVEATNERTQKCNFFEKYFQKNVI